jgi:hypothetical protein
LRTFWGRSGKCSSAGWRIALGVFILLWLCMAVTAEARPSKVYYLYITACESCHEASGLIDALPETIEVTTNGEKFTSPLEVVRINLTADTAGALKLFDAFHVPEEDRTAPMVLAGSAYYAGVDAIRRFISEGLPAGAALFTQAVSGEGVPPALEWGPALAAGFVGGLNPCALSMLLLFLTVLGSLKANVARYAAVFLGTKFVTYLVIGTLLLGAFQAWNPLWLQLVAKIVLTGLSIFLIVLNLRDAWMARGERYGEIKNQLPAPLRRGLQARIRSALEKPFAPLLVVVVALGVLVAAGEFLCAGQVYLATLLAAIQTGRNLNTLWPMLIGYCLAFLAPSVAVSFAVARGQALFTVSEFVRRRMPLIKLVTALFFAATLVYVWVA